MYHRSPDAPSTPSPANILDLAELRAVFGETPFYAAVLARHLAGGWTVVRRDGRAVLTLERRAT